MTVLVDHEPRQDGFWHLWSHHAVPRVPDESADYVDPFALAWCGRDPSDDSVGENVYPIRLSGFESLEGFAEHERACPACSTVVEAGEHTRAEWVEQQKRRAADAKRR